MNFILDNFLIIIVVWIIFNFISFIMFAVDKRKAQNKQWRISEAALIFSSVFGIIGGFCGMYIIRHKTKKPKFYIGLPLILVAEIALICFILIKF